MIGTCQKCNRPLLQRYNGVTFCRRCGESKVSRILEISEKNEATMRLSELCYLRYLVPATGVFKLRRRSALLDDAIALCTEAAEKGHPKAVFRMGYYHEFYFEQMGESERIRRAFDYYYTVCDPEDTKKYPSLFKTQYKSTMIPTPDDYETLKHGAALRIMELFRKYPRVFFRSGAGELDSRYGAARATLIKRFHLGAADSAMGEVGGRSRVLEIYRTLSACYSKKRPPLFGIFLITGKELRELLALRADKKAGREHDAKVMCEKLSFHFLPCDANGDPLAGQRSFQRIREGNLASGAVGDNDHVLFSFFNVDARHTHVSGKSIKQASEDIFTVNGIMRLVSGSSSHRELLLYHEDLLYAEKILKGDIISLVKNICEEG